MVIGLITFNYPIGFIVLCVLFASLVTGISYYKSNPFGEVARWKKHLVVALRFFGTFLIALLLLQPLLKQTKSTIEKPLLPVLVDHSQSIRGTQPGTFAAEELPAFLEELEKKLGDAYEVFPINFDMERVRDSIDFTAVHTDFGLLFSQVKQRFRHAHLGGVVLFTDGIPTRGQAPEYLIQQLDMPLFAIGIGDTSPRVDAKIFNVIANNTVFLDNLFQVEVQVKAEQLSGKSGVLTLVHEGKTISSKPVRFTAPNQTLQFSFSINADKVGLRKYTARISAFEGEENTNNNQQDFFVEVKDSRKKIVLVANNPHPDIAALRRAIENFEEYELEVYTKSAMDKPIADAHVLILHQVPARGDRGIPNAISSFPNNVLHIVGPEMDLRDWQRFQSHIKVTSSPAFENLIPVVNPNFSLFQVEAAFEPLFNSFPPLRGFLNNFEFEGTGESLLQAKIARVTTDRPVLFLGAHENKRFGFINGTGLWRWRIYNFKEAKNHKAFDNLVGQMMQYLSTKELEERLTVAGPTRVNENEPIVFSARLLDANLERTNAPELNLVVKSSAGKIFDYTFNREGDGYGLRIKGLESDQYSFVAKTRIGSENFEKTGSFIIEKIDAEYLDLQARFDWLENAAEQSNGKFYTFTDRNQLIADLENDFKTPALLKTTTDTEPLLSWRVLLFIIVTLLGAEWFLRKYFGAY